MESTLTQMYQLILQDDTLTASNLMVGVKYLCMPLDEQSVEDILQQCKSN